MTKVLIVSNLTSIYSSNRFLKIFSAIIIFLTLFIIFLLSTRAMLILISLSLIFAYYYLLIKFVYKLSFINSIIDF